jgi:maltooligosyltrehalose synthase
VPRLCLRLTADRPAWPLGEIWRDTVLVVPENAPRRWRNALTGTAFTSSVNPDRELAVASVLDSFPVAMLVAD